LDLSLQLRYPPLSHTTEATAQDLQFEAVELGDTQAASIADRGSLDMVARLVMLASLGLIALGNEPLITTIVQSESSYIIRAADERTSILVEALTTIHDTLVRESIELDPRAREVLSESLWDLYAS
jgi:hypothetical protein